MKSLGKDLDKLTEVDALISDIIEDSLVAITLIFHITNLHLQAKALGYLPALNHRVVLTALGFVILLHIHRLGNAVDAFDVISRLKVSLLDLELDQFSSKGNDANVMTGIGLYSNRITFLEIEVIDIVIISFSCILELYFHQVGRLCVSRHIGKPVVSIKLFVLPANAFS